MRPPNCRASAPCSLGTNSNEVRWAQGCRLRGPHPCWNPSTCLREYESQDECPERWPLAGPVPVGLLSLITESGAVGPCAMWPMAMPMVGEAPLQSVRALSLRTGTPGAKAVGICICRSSILRYLYRMSIYDACKPTNYRISRTPRRARRSKDRARTSRS